MIELANRLIDAGITSSNAQVRSAANWTGINYHADWHYTRSIANGIGTHHGSIPRALAHWSVKAFNEGWLNFLLCTTTLIEGVNTRAENLIILDSKVMGKPIDFFTFNNIKGRAGRMMTHFVGNVFAFSNTPQVDLPFVDFQFITQPENTSSSILLELDDSDMSDRSKEKVSQFRNSALLSWETLRQSGLDPLQQLAAAKVIDSNPQYWAHQFSFTTYPQYEQIKAISILMWDCFSGSKIASGAVRSSAQLTVLIYNLRSTSIKQIISNFIEYGVRQTKAYKKPLHLSETGLCSTTHDS